MQSLQLPADLLRAAYLVGKTPFRTCTAEPRVSYSLYVPDQYIAAHKELQQGHAQKLKLLINIHGTRREVEQARDSLISLADEHGIVILAPLYPAGMDDVQDLSSYKRLDAKTYRADLILLAILDEIESIWPAIDTKSVLLSGFSGGAQFAHRIAYLYPERFFAVAIGAPGSVTMVNDRPWPEGVADSSVIFGRSVSIERLTMPIFLYVGDEDKQDLDPRLRSLITSKHDQIAPTMRKHAVEQLHQHWIDHGVNVELEIVQGVAHNYAALVPALVNWLTRVVR